jgi:hypothetical protein
MKHTIAVLLILLSSLSPALSADKKIRIAYVERTGKKTEKSALKEQLKRIGLKGYDVTAKIRDKKFKPASYDALLVGSFALSDRTLQKWFRSEAASLRNFVRKGGVVLTLAQDIHDWDIEPWLPEKAFLLRSNSRFESLGFIDRDHPLFGKPHSLSLDRINTDWKGDKTWPDRFLSLRTIQKARPALVLAAQDADGKHPWVMEMGWGKGRCLFFSCAPDRTPPDPSSPAHRICDAFLENALSYAAAVSAGAPHPLPEEVAIADEDVEKRVYLQPVSKEKKKAFKKRVDACVDRGVTWLKGKQREDGSWGPFSDGWGNKFEPGLTALSLLALLNSGVSKHDKAIEKGFDFIYAHHPRHTYEVAFTLMAMEMRAAPMYERFTLARMDPGERRKYTFKRDLTSYERNLMQELTGRLIACQHKGGSWRYNLEKTQHDISNGQFAVLGLKAAGRCGITAPKEVWEEILDYFISHQAKDGPKVRLREFKSWSRTGTPEFYVVPAKARGWSYHYGYPAPGSVVGSHVNIGLSCLILSHEELVKLRSPFAAKSRQKIRQAIRDGLAWLSDNWCIDARPNGGKCYFHYYVYSLGRVGTLVESPFIGDHDWYREMGDYVMEKQFADGHWGIRAGEWGSNISATSFTLLFLMRSTPPPVFTLGK